MADTFTGSLAKLTGNEQKAVKTTSFDLQMNPTNTGMQFHRIDKAKDPNFWSIRVSRDIRIIVHKSKSDLLLCYVDHHDNAYKWAERRKLETHPSTGAMQIVEIRETVQEITIPYYIAEEESVHPVLAHISRLDLLEYGVPEEWIEDIKSANEDRILEIAEHLPAEAAEAVLNLATGSEAIKPISTLPKPLMGDQFAPEPDPFVHPDALRRFRTIENLEELERALEYPWEKWSIFLHPEQQRLVKKNYDGPARINGTAGTGKTIVALHRSFYLAKTNPDARILLTTFSDTLANVLKRKLDILIVNKPKISERLEVFSLDGIAKRLFELNYGHPQIASSKIINEIIDKYSKEIQDHKFPLQFLISEWEQVVDAWQLETWESYRDVLRLGRKTKLPENQRTILWSIFELVMTYLRKNGVITQSAMYAQLTSKFSKNRKSPFDYIVVDEAQDISVPQLRFIAAIGNRNQDSLFFTGDLGQRIFQQSFSWKELGVDIGERSNTLRINYRTSHQIRIQADRLLDHEISDVDGNTENRLGAISVFNGPKPNILILDTTEEEDKTVSKWLSERMSEGVKPHEIGLFVRSSLEFNRGQQVVESAKLSSNILNENTETRKGQISICSMHLTKGLEFRAVVVMACDDEIIPLQKRIETVTDDVDLEEVYSTERHLLYVACTRARDHLLVTGVNPASEFLEDLL